MKEKMKNEKGSEGEVREVQGKEFLWAQKVKNKK